MPDIKIIQKKAEEKILLTREECLAVLEFPGDKILELLNAAYTVRKKIFGNKVQVQMLINAKSGLCTEDCGYCTQSRVSTAEIGKYPLKSSQELLAGAKLAKKSKAVRYCIALSGIRYEDDLIHSLARSIKKIKEEAPISICCSIGFLTAAQARELKAAGLDRINHNLNSGRDFYPKICTTHKYEERLENLRICRGAGLEICSGGIIGLGETNNDQGI